jgi:hypothetical protein
MFYKNKCQCGRRPKPFINYTSPPSELSDTAQPSPTQRTYIGSVFTDPSLLRMSARPALPVERSSGACSAPGLDPQAFAFLGVLPPGPRFVAGHEACD